VFKKRFTADVRIPQKQINKGHVKAALTHLERHLIPKTDGCALGEGPDRNDCITDCNAKKQVYWSLHEIDVLLKIAQ
jgi:hypothetical protein